MSADFIEQAKRLGYTDQEIQSYLSTVNNASDQPVTTQTPVSDAVVGSDSMSQTPVSDATLGNDQTTQTPVSDTVLKSGNSEFYRKALEVGYTEDDITKFMSEQQGIEYKDRTNPSILVGQKTSMPIDDQIDTAQDIVAAYQNIHTRWSTLGKLAAGAVFDEELTQVALQDISKINQGVITKLRELGVNAFIDQTSGRLMVADSSGMQHEIESTIFKDLMASKFELGGALTMGIIGAKAGASLAGGAALALGQAGPQALLPEELITVPAAMGIGGIIGGLGGGFIGAATGAGLDGVLNSLFIKEELEAKLILDKMVDAGVADATMTIIAGAAWKIAKPIATRTFRFIGHAYNVFKDGNQQGAYAILLRDQNITKEQADDIIAKWRQLAATNPDTGAVIEPKVTNAFGVERTANDTELAVKVISETQPGGEAIIAATESSSVAVTHAVSGRAKELLATVDRLAPGEPAVEIRRALQDHQTDVGKFYEVTKRAAGDVIDRTDYRFDIDRLAIRPALKEVGKHIDDPYQVERFTNIMRRIDMVAETRTFSDLLDLRQMINSIKSKATKKIAQESLKKSIMAIDSEIQRATNAYLPPQQATLWRNQFRQAKKEYAELKILESNILFRGIVGKRGVTEDQIVKRLSDLAPALDDTFVSVMEKLPRHLRIKTEGAVLKLLTSRYTVGLESELQAVHFPELASKLRKYKFTSPAAKEYVDTVEKFAEVFKNDVQLGRVIGGIQIPRFQSYLTTDPVQRAKYEMASGIFNYVKRLAPTAKASRMALVSMVGKMLDEPLNAKTTASFIRQFPREEQHFADRLVRNFQREWAIAQTSGSGMKSVRLYAATNDPAKTLVKTSGKFGRGYYMTESLANPRETRPIARREVDRSKLATIETVQHYLGDDVTVDTLRKHKQYTNILREAGYEGFTHDGKVMLFEGN